MPFASAGDCSLYYETAGHGPTVAFLNDVGYGAWQWGWQHAALAGPFEALVFDPRGTARSDATRGPFTSSDLAADLEAVLADHGTRRAHLVGAGLGGMVALAYACEYNRARSVTLAGTALAGDAVDADVLDAMEEPRDGLVPCFSPSFLDEQPAVVEKIVEWRREEDADADARRAQADALLAFECNAPHEITLPALVLHGDDDPLVPVTAGERLADALPRGQFETLDGRHLALVESSKHANDAITGFLEEVEDG